MPDTTYEIARIWIDESNRLLVAVVLPPDLDFTYIYRAARGVRWDPSERALTVPRPETSTYADRFADILEAASDEYGARLLLTSRTDLAGLPPEVASSISS